MDRFVIKSGGKKPNEAETSQNKRKSKVDRDRDYFILVFILFSQHINNFQKYLQNLQKVKT